MTTTKMRTSGPDCFVLLSVVVFLSGGTISAPEIRFSFGRVQGVDNQAVVTGKPYYAYYAIPFAQPPLGDLRFQAPKPFVERNPNDVISSPTPGPACTQVYYSGPVSEDCLQLNVYAPASAPAGQLKKVMIFIHGGAYNLGSANYSIPSRLVTEYDIIVVTIQYRLGAFGFASSMDSALPGNYGLRDQILAIQWVKNNIHEFGGDGNDITIAGQSAGSSSVCLLSLSPATTGLFTKGIMQSGTALSFFARAHRPVELLYNLADKVNCTPSQQNLCWIHGVKYHEQIVSCLKTKTADELNVPPTFIGIGKTFNMDLNNYHDFAPVIDGDIIPRDPETMLQNPNYLRQVGALNRSYIVGMTNAEGIAPYDILVTGFGASLENFTESRAAANYTRTSILTQIPPGTGVTPAMQSAVDFVYTYPRDILGRANVQGLLDLNLDTAYLVPSVQFCRYITAASNQTNVFLYLFDHYPKLRDPDSPLKGSKHGLDLMYEFDYSYTNKISGLYDYVSLEEPSLEPVFDVFAGSLSNFVRTGNPNRSQNLCTVWPRYDRQQEFYMAIADTPEVRQHLFAKRFSLWVDFLLKMARVGQCWD